MTYGILIGLIIVGGMIIWANGDGGEAGTEVAQALTLGMILFVPSLLGLIGKIIEAVS